MKGIFYIFSVEDLPNISSFMYAAQEKYGFFENAVTIYNLNDSSCKVKGKKLPQVLAYYYLEGESLYRFSNFLIENFIKGRMEIGKEQKSIIKYIEYHKGKKAKNISKPLTKAVLDKLFEKDWAEGDLKILCENQKLLNEIGEGID